MFAFSRDNEREADEIGMQLMADAGYDPREAPKTWEALLAERAAMKDPGPGIFFATHPPTEERVAALKALAERSAAGAAEPDVGADRYRAALRPFRAGLLRDELRLRRPAATQLVLDRLLAETGDPGEVHFFQGELYRLRADAGDDAKAIAAYERALASDSAPPETQRSLGVVLMRTKEPARARAAFARYLELQPDAEDRDIVRDYLRSLP